MPSRRRCRTVADIYADDIVRILSIDRDGQHYVIVAGQAIAA
jgi:hypothetical protein